MKYTMYKALGGLAIAASLITPVAAQEMATECEGITDRGELRECMRNEWQSSVSARKDMRTQMRTENAAVRTEAKNDYKMMHEENMAEHEAALDKCKTLRAEITVTDGMVSVADLDAVVSCYRDIATMKREHMSEMKDTRTTTRMQIRTNRTETREAVKMNLQDSIQTRRAAQTQVRGQLQHNRGTSLKKLSEKKSYKMPKYKDDSMQEVETEEETETESTENE